MPYGMPYGMKDLTQVMGIGSYVGEVRRGPDGQPYQWVEGVDGLGNTIGFWKGLKKLASKAIPLATKFIPGIGPIIEQVRGTVKGFCTGLPKLGPVVEQSPDIKPVYQIGTKLCSILSKAGIAGVEDGMMQAPDGQLYEVVEGIGESGQVKRYLRPVWMSIPVVIRPRGSRLVAKRGIPAQSTVRAAQPAVPGAPVVPAQPVAPVRRFR
jgi:hypothetical protein